MRSNSDREDGLVDVLYQVVIATEPGEPVKLLNVSEICENLTSA